MVSRKNYNYFSGGFHQINNLLISIISTFAFIINLRYGITGK